MTSTDLALANDDRYLANIPAMADTFAKSNLCPDQFRGKPNDVAVAAYSLAALGVRLSFPTLAQCYIVKGKPGLMAQLQVALAARYGVHIRPKTDEHGRPVSTPEVGIVEVTLPDGTTNDVQFTIAQAKAAKLTEKDNWKEYGPDMLIARATTRAVTWYCPEVKLGMAGTVDAEEIDATDRPPAPRPPRSETPTGTTIPEKLREPAIDDAERAAILDTIDALGDDAKEHLRLAAVELRIPNLHTDRVTKAHGALVRRLIAEAIHNTAGPEAPGAAGTASPAAQPEPESDPGDSAAPGQPGPADTSEATPTDVHDDAPESRGLWDADDPARPF